MTPLDRLSRLRTLSARESPEVVKLGKEVLASGVKLGEQGRLCSPTHLLDISVLITAALAW